MTTLANAYASPPPHVLIIDDDRELCELLALRIESKGYRVTAEHGVKAALARLQKESTDVVLLDLRLEDGDGFEVLNAIQKRTPDLPVIVLTAHGSIDTAVEATRSGAFGFVTKPFHDQDLLQRIAHGVESHRMRSELAGLRRVVSGQTEQGQLVGISPAIENVRQLISRVAPSDVTVLVVGESGTGKELVARSLHNLSPRSKAPFLAVNCAALAPTLLESTLFGHVKGSFTGAIADRQGLFGAARKGTLFLDEISEAPLEVQAKLLRVLQERRFTRVGSMEEEEADVRILAASNRDLQQEVAERRFREDLFYRLHVVPISVPPLRDRREDIELLARLFLERAAARGGATTSPRISERAMAALKEHPWPGNVRELGNVMEAAFLLSGAGEISVEHLPGVGLASLPANGAASIDDLATSLAKFFGAYTSESGPVLPSLRDARDALDRAYLDSVLSRAAGSVTVAARLAGRNRTDFYDLLRRHGRSPANYKRS